MAGCWPPSCWGDPSNGNAAMLLLGIAEMTDLDDAPRLKLTSWAVQTALGRRVRTGLTARELADAQRNSLNLPKVNWPQANGQ